VYALVHEAMRNTPQRDVRNHNHPLESCLALPAVGAQADVYALVHEAMRNTPQGDVRKLSSLDGARVEYIDAF
jgi:hypothetical protein